MTILSWVFLVLFAFAAAAAVWLLLQRQSALAAVATERALKEEAARRATDAETRLASLAERIAETERTLAEATTDAGVLRERLVQTEDRHREAFESQERHHAERIAAEKRALADARAEFDSRAAAMQDHFRKVIQSTAADALKQSTEQLLKLTESKIKDATDKAGVDLDARRAAVENLVKPIADTLKRTDEKLQQFDRERAASVSALTQQAASMTQAHEALRRETANLSNALRKPQVRGQWGEVQLRRVIELAGMRDYCDFAEQHASNDQDGTNQRPDVVVKMPGDRTVIIDAKANIGPYLEALDADTDAARETCMQRFAAGLADQVSKLSDKAYWKRFDATPEFVVMFVPGDQFVDAALSRRPDLIESAASERVILASPSTLIGLLRAIYVGWREQHVSQRADELIRLGRELHERTAVVLGHAEGLGDALNKAVEKYNQFQRSMDTRIMPTLRRFEELDARSEKQLTDPPAIVTLARVNALPGRAAQARSPGDHPDADPAISR